MPEGCIFCFIGNDKICQLCLKDRKQYYNRTFYIKKTENKITLYKRCFTCKIEKHYEEYIDSKHKHRECFNCRKKKIKKYNKLYYNTYIKRVPKQKELIVPDKIEIF